MVVKMRMARQGFDLEAFALCVFQVWRCAMTLKNLNQSRVLRLWGSLQARIQSLGVVTWPRRHVF